MPAQLPRRPFGSTGHDSSRVIFGAAALMADHPRVNERALELLLEYGVNHIDVGAAYGKAEEALGRFLPEHRKGFFLATKTVERSYAGARDDIQRSLERMRCDRIDLIQLHNLVDERDHEQALGDDGALRALVEARDAGWVRFLGVTGHGSFVAAMHRRSLERFPFDSVLLPCNYTMLAQPDYAADFEALLALCAEGSVAVQTIKSLARRRWQDEGTRRFSWYEPLRDPEAVCRAVHFVLARPGVFLNSSSDATLLPAILEAAAEAPQAPAAGALEADVARHAMEPLFVPDGPQGV